MTRVRSLRVPSPTGRSLAVPFVAALAAAATSALAVSGCAAPARSRDATGPGASRVAVAKPETSIKTAPAELPRAAVLLELSGALCTGVLVTPTRVLTAAHCLAKIGRADLAVARFGVDMRTPAAAIVGAGTLRVHPVLDLGTLDLAEPAPAGFVPARVLPVDARVAPGEELVFAGYGKTGENVDNAGQFLRWGKFLFERWESQIDYSDGHSYRSVLSFRPSAGGSAVCQGDSGGPVMKAHAGAWGLVGVTSGGSLTCDDGAASSFIADARPNAEWIFEGADAPVDEGGAGGTAADGCDVSAQSPTVNGLNVRVFDDVSPVVAAVMKGVTLPLFGATKAPGRWPVRVAGYVHEDETNCRGDVVACAAGLAATGKSFRLADAFGAALRASPADGAPITAVVSPGTRLRLLQKAGAWHYVDFTGTVSQAFCARR